MTPALALDVDTANELIERARVSEWARWTEGLFHPTPYIDIDDAERLGSLQGWLKGRHERPVSPLWAPQGGVRVGDVDVPLEEIRFVRFDVRVIGATRGTRCGDNGESS